MAKEDFKKKQLEIETEDNDESEKVECPDCGKPLTECTCRDPADEDADIEDDDTVDLEDDSDSDF